MYYVCMNRIFLSLAVVSVIGCAPIPRQPVDVAMIPNDCANQTAITRWLENTARASKSPLQTQAQYEQQISSVKARMWSLRYHCNRVR